MADLLGLRTTGAIDNKAASGGASAASQAEVDAGTVADEYVAPLTLANYPPILLKVKNTTGGTLTAGSMVYTVWVTGSGMEAKSPASASVLYATTAAVVVVGGANNATVLVATRGRHSIFYSSTAPSIGDYLILGAANTVTRQTYMSPEVVAIAMAAGSGGSVDALLLTGRVVVPTSDTHYIYGVQIASDSDFTSTIATLPGGSDLTYGAITTGAENAIDPWAGLDADFNAKLTLHNTTRGTSALISAVVIGTNTITLTAAVPVGWVVGDTITARSPTNTQNWSGGAYYFEYDMSGFTSKPPLATAILIHSSISDTSATVAALSSFHPFEAFASSKNLQLWSQAGAANVRFLAPIFVNVINSKFCLGWDATGSGTTTLFGSLAGWIVAVP